MALTWSIVDLERNPDNGVVVAHWVAEDSEGEHSASRYGSCGFVPEPTSDGYIAYENLNADTVIAWVKSAVDEDAVAENIAAQIARLKIPPLKSGVPWSS